MAADPGVEPRPVSQESTTPPARDLLPQGPLGEGETSSPDATTLLRGEVTVAPSEPGTALEARPTLPEDRTGRAEHRAALAGKRLGPYVLLDELGHGGMGVVYRARHEGLGIVRAVKVLLAGEHASVELLARFQREAAGVARLGAHPNLVAVHDLGCDTGIAYYAMELIDGQTLRAWARDRVLSPRESAAQIEKVARALHFAHQSGIIHRDIKPENILIRADGEPLVMDFGLARDLDATLGMSVTGQVMGTPNYMAPEQVRGDVHATDARTDVYALGAVLYEMLTGSVAHPGAALAQVFQSILRGEVVTPRTLRGDIPADLESICLKCLSSEPEGRYLSAAALADDLARWIAGEPVHARPVSRLRRWVRRAKRNRLVSGLLAAVALLVLAFSWRYVGPGRVHLIVSPASASVSIAGRLSWGGVEEPSPDKTRDEQIDEAMNEARGTQKESVKRFAFWVWPPGECRVQVSDSGYEERTEGVNLTGGESLVINAITLKPSSGQPGTGTGGVSPDIVRIAGQPGTVTGRVSLDSVPSRAEVWIDGQLGPRATPWSQVRVPRGEHALEVRLPGYMRRSLRITVVQGRHLQLGNIVLTRSQGRLTITGEAGVMVVVRSEGDGAEVAKLALPVADAPFDSGRYRVIEAAAGAAPKELHVEVRPGETTSVDFYSQERTHWRTRVLGGLCSTLRLVDLDRDGLPDCVATSADGTVHAIRGKDGCALWTVDTGAPIHEPATVGDLDLDGVRDVLVAPRGLLAALSGRDGARIWSKGVPGPATSAPSVGDVDGDGIADAVLGFQDGQARAFRGENGESLWSADSGGEVRAAPEVVDLDGDGLPECVLTSVAGRVTCLAASDGALRWRRQVGYALLARPALGDLNGDGTRDAVVSCCDHRVYAFSGKDGTDLWKFSAARSIHASPILEDLNGDGTPDCLVGSIDQHVYAISGRSGSLLWTCPMAAPIGSAPALCDLNRDGPLEALLFDWNGDLVVLSARDGGVLRRFHTGGDRWASPVITDLDGDGHAEVVLATQGEVVAFPMPGGPDSVESDRIGALDLLAGRRKWTELARAASEVAREAADPWNRGTAWVLAARAHYHLRAWNDCLAACRQARDLRLKSPEAAVLEWSAARARPDAPPEIRSVALDHLREAALAHPDAFLDEFVSVEAPGERSLPTDLAEILTDATRSPLSRPAAVVLWAWLDPASLSRELLMTTRTEIAADTGGRPAVRRHAYLAVLAGALDDRAARVSEREAFFQFDVRPEGLERLFEADNSPR